MRLSLITVIAVTCLALGCSKKEAATGEEKPAEPATSAKVDEKAEAAPAAGEPDGEPDEAAQAAAQAAAGEAAAAEFTGDKAKLARTYVDIYCAQRKGETERLLDIYTKAGFEDPKVWTAQWTEATKDKAWVARVTQEAIRACP